MGQERLDLLVEQEVNQTLFEGVVKTFIKDSQPAHNTSRLPTPSSDEENIVRYAAGYVSMKLMKKYEAESTRPTYVLSMWLATLCLSSADLHSRLRLSRYVLCCHN